MSLNKLNPKINDNSNTTNIGFNDNALVSKCDPELYAWLILAMTHGVGPATVLKLIRHFGNANNIINQDINTLSQFINRTIAGLIVNQNSKTNVEKSLEWVFAKDNRYIIHFASLVYPKELAEVFNAPPILYLEGNINLLSNRNKLAMVGTRHPSTQGREDAFRFGRELANNGFTVVSGMASGIDRYVHLGALAGQCGTIGVIGTGMDMCYPASNKDLFEQVRKEGLLISEFPLQTSPLAQNFPRRNRIIAGLSLGCLVVEATVDSGSLITANLALEMGRDVMAIPGSIHNPFTRGCHKLIKNGAKLVETISDILEEFNLFHLKDDVQEQGIAMQKTNECKQMTNKQGLETKHQELETMGSNLNFNLTHPILNLMGFDPISIDEICLQSRTSFSDICSELLELELKGLIQNCGNGCYQRIIK